MSDIEQVNDFIRLSSTVMLYNFISDIYLLLYVYRIIFCISEYMASMMSVRESIVHVYGKDSLMCSIVFLQVNS